MSIYDDLLPKKKKKEQEQVSVGIYSDLIPKTSSGSAKPTPQPTPTPKPTLFDDIVSKVKKGAEVVMDSITHKGFGGPSNNDQFQFNGKSASAPAPNFSTGNTAGASATPQVTKDSLERAKKVVDALNYIPDQFSRAFPETVKAVGSFQADAFSLDTSNIHKAIPDMVKTVKDAWTLANQNQPVAKTLSQLVAFSPVGIATGMPTMPMSNAKEVGKSLENITRTAGVPLSLFSALFSGANDLPVARALSKALTVPFTAIGEGAPKVSNKIIDAIPNNILPPEDKAALKPGVGETFSLALQLLAGKAMEVGPKKVATLAKKYGANDAQIIADTAVKLATERKAVEVVQKQEPTVLTPEAVRIQIEGPNYVDTPATRALQTFVDQAESKQKNIEVVMGGGSKEEGLFKATTPTGVDFTLKLVDQHPAHAGPDAGITKAFAPVTHREIVKIDKAQYPGMESGTLILRPNGTASIDVRFAKEAQGKGQGTKAVAELEQIARDRGASKMEIAAFTEAQGFWEKQGYNVVPGATTRSSLLVKMDKVLTIRQKVAEVAVKDNPEVVKALREAKGLSVDDIIKKHPDLNLKRDVPVTDIHGKKSIIPKGEALTPYELKGNKVVLQDGETYIVSKNQFENVKNNSQVAGDAKEFAPELKQVESVTKGVNSITEADKAELQKLIIANDMLGFDSVREAVSALKEPGGMDNFEFNSLADKQTIAKILDKTGAPTNFSSYQLPNGKNYKEVLIKAPSGDDKPYILIQRHGTPAEFKNHDEAMKFMDQLSPSEKLGASIRPAQGANDFKSSHWSEPNVISHLRMNERTYKGKAVTFMEELQSDWAREGRDKGFIDPQKAIEAATFESFLRDKYNLSSHELIVGNNKVPQAEQLKLSGLNIAKTSGIPHHPLLKNWQELSIKRALQEAVANKSEYFAWINGEQTSARYKLSTQIEKIGWEKLGNDKIINMIPKDSSPIDVAIDDAGVIKDRLGGTPTDWIGKKLDEVVGKGLADKIMEKEKGTLEGEGLNFGGEWAKNLYDKQVKSIVEDLTSAKVETLDFKLPVGSPPPPFDLLKDVGTGRGTREKLTSKNIKKDAMIADSNGDYHIVTGVLRNGEFKAVKRTDLFENKTPKSTGEVTLGGKTLYYYPEAQKSYSLGEPKTAMQQGIKLTPEVKAIIEGKALQLKKPSGKNPFEAAPVEPPLITRTFDATGKETTNAPKGAKVLTGNEVKAIRDIIQSKFQHVKETASSAEEITKGVDEIVKYVTERAGNDKQVLSALRTELNQEMYGFAGGGNYKEQFRTLQILKKEDPEMGPVIENLEGHILQIDEQLVTTAVKPEKTFAQVINPAKAFELSKKKPEPLAPGEVGVPRDQLPIGTGEEASSALQERVAKALKGLSQEQIDALGQTEFNRMNNKETIAKAAEYVIKNPDEAIRVLTGELQPPEGLNSNSIFVAMANNAVGDFKLATKLATLKSTAMGQNIEILKELNVNSPVKIISDIYKVKEADFQKRFAGQTVAQVKRKYIARAKAQMEAPKLNDWSSIVKSVRC